MEKSVLPEGIVRCPFCGMWCNGKEDLVMHLNLKHRKPKWEQR
jgi:uncharacterized C2H2 Zn-finger protein